MARRFRAILSASPEQLPALWQQSESALAKAVRDVQHARFRDTLDEAAAPVLALIARDPDLAILQVVRQSSSDHTQYGARRSLHAAIATHLVAQRLGWEGPRITSAFKAALTMNLSMLELQGRLAAQVTPLTALQREAIRNHPLRSVEMLEAAGITDRDWLDAVAQHHEVPDGSGYPHGRREATELAELVWRADIYTAKLSSRSTRVALAANRAAREIFMQDPRHPMNSALVKEFGVYPPGCFVRLASGESGVVVKRGPSANTPIVATLTSGQGQALKEPERRDTGAREHQIVDVVGEQSLRVRVTPEQLISLAGEL